MSAYAELFRVLAPDSTAVVVNGWSSSRLMNAFEPLMRLAYSIRHLLFRLSGRSPYLIDELEDGPASPGAGPGEVRGSTRQDGQHSHPSRFARSKKAPKGTFTNKHDADWVKTELGALMPVEVLVWRSVTVRFMRALDPPSAGWTVLVAPALPAGRALPALFRRKWQISIDRDPQRKSMRL